MHRTIGYLSKRFVQIRPGEGRKVFLTFLYFFLIITAYYVVKPVSRSLILGGLGSRMVPYVDLVCAVLMGPVVTLFARSVDRLPKHTLVSRSFWIVIGILVVFWKLLAWPVPWVAGALYVWVSIVSVLVVTLFWLVANDLYHPREARRLFGFIGSGGILGGVAGSSIAAFGAQVIGTEHLLLVSAGLLVVCWLVVQRLWTFAPEPRTAETKTSPSPQRDTFLSDTRGFARLIFQSRYLLLLIALVGLNKLIDTLVYYQFNPFIEQTFPQQDARTTFTSMFFGGMNVVAFVIQFFFTSWMLRRWGLMTSLLALPVGVLAGTAGLLVMPVFWLAASTELYDGSLNYSLQQTTKEMLYLPIDRSIRYKVKPFIDMVVFRFGKGIAAVIGIVLLSTMHLPVRVLGWLSVPLVIAWIVIAIWLRREYVALIRAVLQARAVSRASPQPSSPAGASDGSPEPVPAKVMNGHSHTTSLSLLVTNPTSAHKLALMQRVMALKPPASSPAKTLLAELAAYETGREAGKSTGRDMSPDRLKDLISDHGIPITERRRALEWLARSAEQTTVDYLCGLMVVEPDVTLRQEAVKTLVRLRLQKVRLEFPVSAIRRSIAREVSEYQRIVQIGMIFRQHHRGPLASDDPTVALLEVLMEDTVEQIFRLLMLLYRPEDIHLVYEQLRAPDVYVRADAIELLDNLVDPAMRLIILPILDEDRFLSQLTDGPATIQEPTVAYRVLQEAIWDHHCWLSVTTLCAIGRMRLTVMGTELEKASRHPTPVIAAAAKAALHLATLS